jgi:type IV secretory pathway VirB2 component (pilin)
MVSLLSPAKWCRITNGRTLRRIRQPLFTFVLTIIFPALAFAQSGTLFDTGFTSLQNLFTGTIAKVASLIAIVVGGYQFAHGEPGAKNSRFAYVSVSRASHDARIYTNDSASVAKSLSHDVTKSSAIGLGANRIPVASPGMEQTTALKESPAAGLGLAL